jgi:hypothetical protein
MKKTVFLFLSSLILLSQYSFAQDSKKLMVNPGRFDDVDSVKVKGPKKHRYNYSIGMQTNDLWKQILPLSSSASGSNNPYLIMASIHSKKTGWGMKIGGNFTNSNFTDQDAANKRISKINSTFCKLGFEKYIVLSI